MLSISVKKSAALFITLLIVVVAFGNYLFFSEKANSREKVVIVRVIDGDTLETDTGMTIRLLNVNTPEKKEAYYAEAKSFTEQLINRSVEIEIAGTEKYGRTLGRIYAPYYFNLALVENGFAHTLLVSDEETKTFAKAEENARLKEKGIWRHSYAYGCLKGTINSKKELVSLIKTCNVSVIGWTVKDETTHSYSFRKDFSSIDLFSQKGTDGDNSIYWGRGNVWNDDRDSLFIRDTKGDLVYFYQYGYA